MAPSSNQRWHDNANEIATFLHGANSKHWPLKTLQSAMNMHLDQTLDEATHQLKGDYAASVKDYDRVVQHIFGMADVLSDGIIAQFPAKFTSNKSKRNSAWMMRFARGSCE